MVAQLVGVQRVNFTNAVGEAIRGTNLFCAYSDENVEVLRIDKFFLKEAITLPKDIKLNDKIEIVFNRKGRVEKVEKA